MIEKPLKTSAAIFDVAVPTVSFTFTNNNSCSGILMRFTSTASGAGNLIYSWDFGDGSTSNLQNPLHRFDAFGCGPDANFTVFLTVTDIVGSTTVSQIVTVKRRPFINVVDLNPGVSGPFENCNISGAPYDLTIGLDPNSDPCVTSFSVDWGDGTIDNNVTFPLTHSYINEGFFDLVITGFGVNGCTSKRTYVVSNSSNPEGGIVTPGATVYLCLPASPLEFAISNWGDNPPDTVYNVDYGDGTIISLNQVQMESSIYYNSFNPAASADYPIPHTYTVSNCPDPDYYVSLNIVTACGVTNLTAGPISVYQKPEVSFIIPDNGCVNTPVPITNTSNNGYTFNCDTTVTWFWDMGDGTTYSDFEPTHSYANPGSYTISLYAQNHCGITEIITHEICVEAALIPEFTVSITEGCTPYSTILGNTTVIENPCTIATFEWVINYIPDFCGTTNGATFINGTDATSEIAEIEFTAPGRYEIVLEGTNACGRTSSTPQEILVTAPPEVEIQPIGYLCGENPSVEPIATVSNCSSESATYFWSLDIGASPIDWEFVNGTGPNSISPEINFYTLNNYVLRLEVTNSCGTTIDSETIMFSEVPTMTNTNVNQDICSGTMTDEIVFSSTYPANTSYTWTGISPTNNITGVIPTGNTSTIPPHQLTLTSGATGTVAYTVIPYLVEDCPGDPMVFTITVNESPSIITQPIGADYCLGDTILDLEVVVANGVGTPTYQWYSNTTNNTVTPTPVGTNSNTLVVPNTGVSVFYYYCVITFPGGGCGAITTDIVPIVIGQTPEISDYETTICSDNAFQIIPDSSNGDIVPSNATYTWPPPVVNPAGAINGATGQLTPTTNISQTLVNTTNSPATATYTITPSSGNCIGESFEVVVTVIPSISVDAILTHNSCSGWNDGAIEISISGGIPFSGNPPYVIIWAGPNGYTSTDEDIYNLIAGTYVLEVTDNGGCNYTETFTITEPEELRFGTVLFDPETISCFGANDGTIDITVEGGTLPYVYTWTKDGIPFSNDEDLSDLGPGTYVVSVTDANECSAITQRFVIEEPPVLVLSLDTQTNVLCYGESTGALGVSVVGGRPGYTYDWDGPNGYSSNDQNIDNIFAGIYTVVATDSSGCEVTEVFEITQNDEISIEVSLTQIACYGDNDGSITIHDISGGVGPYTVVWSNFGTGMLQTDLSPGLYTITITDSLNCSKSFTYEIEEVPVFLIDPEVIQISCVGANDARIVLNFQGGTPPINVVWDDDPIAGVERNNLGPGTYTVTITDGVPCVIQESFTIVEPAEIELLAEVTDALDCDNADSGSIQLSISGGTPPYSIMWSNGTTTEDLQNIPPNTYYVTVIDANGCQMEGSWEVKRPRPLEVEIQDQSEFDCEAHTAIRTFTAVASGGVPPYQFFWSSGTVSGANNETMTTTASGLVTLEVIDNRGCRITRSMDVEIPELGDPNFEATSFGYTNFGFFASLDPIQFTNTSTGNYEGVSWNFGDGNSSTEENPTHTYQHEGTYVVTLTVIYPFGCVYTYTRTLVIKKGYRLIMPNAFTPNDDGLNDFLGPNILG
ncbi:MAG TPA: PKD domain-containing protein [Flavobacteriaceae bacterium]|nr:PKD domain-containing protein [Flavobacteriaceae bacterium]